MRLSLPRLKGRRSPVAVHIETDEQHWADQPGVIRFETAWARRRFIPIEPMSDAIQFMAPRARHWPGQDPQITNPAPQLVTRSVLPDTVTCGSGYIEVLAFEHNGIVVNEVRTVGDAVFAMPGVLVPD